jgi:hypothetical protein
MTLRYLIAAFGVLLITGASGAQADSYKPDSYKPGDYLLLDLQKAVLSPKLLGPPAEFEQVQIEARGDSQSDPTTASARTAAAKAVPVAKATRTAAKPRPPARARVARSRGNPLDANASDTRVQVWPCRTGGICNWQR